MFDLKFDLCDKDDALAVMTGGASLLVTESRKARKEAQKEQNKARAAERRLQNIRAARERRQAARQARMARAQIESGAVASGTTGTSSFAGGVGGVQTQLASNVSFLNQAQQLTNQQSIFEQKAANKLGKAQDLEGLRDLAIRGGSLFAGGA